jgi:hypothetical protein
VYLTGQLTTRAPHCTLGLHHQPLSIRCFSPGLGRLFFAVRLEIYLAFTFIDISWMLPIGPTRSQSYPSLAPQTKSQSPSACQPPVSLLGLNPPLYLLVYPQAGTITLAIPAPFVRSLRKGLTLAFEASLDLKSRCW